MAHLDLETRKKLLKAAEGGEAIACRLLMRSAVINKDVEMLRKARDVAVYWARAWNDIEREAGEAWGDSEMAAELVADGRAPRIANELHYLEVELLVRLQHGSIAFTNYGSEKSAAASLVRKELAIPLRLRSTALGNMVCEWMLGETVGSVEKAAELDG